VKLQTPCSDLLQTHDDGALARNRSVDFRRVQGKVLIADVGLAQSDDIPTVPADDSEYHARRKENL
jgi:hypothetical protein